MIDEESFYKAALDSMKQSYMSNYNALVEVLNYASLFEVGGKVMTKEELLDVINKVKERVMKL